MRLASAAEAAHDEAMQTDWDLKLLYDGDCPLCAREVRLLARLNKRGRLALEDIAAPGFDPTPYGHTYEQLMGQMHGVLPDGRIVTGMEVFRRAYAAVGLGALAAPTGWPLVRLLFDRGYAWFARHRLALTGRSCDTRCEGPRRAS